jgi:hypothetical protein
VCRTHNIKAEEELVQLEAVAKDLWADEKVKGAL